MADNINFDFEAEIESSHLIAQAQQQIEPPDLPAEAIGQQPANYRKNFRKTVCTYWLRGLCMKGEACGFLHQFVTDRMPVCRNLLKYGECHDQDCPYKHSMDEVKECNMYKLGFCIYGPACRYKHIKNPGPPPPPQEVEAAKPREHRNINLVVNQVNPGVAREEDRPNKRPRPFGERDRDGGRDRGDRRRLGDRDRPLALPAPPGGPPGGGGGGGGGRFDGDMQRGRDGGPRGGGGGPRDRDRGGGRGGGGWRGGGDDDPSMSMPMSMPPLMAPGGGGGPGGSLPPMAGLIAPQPQQGGMPGIMPPGPGGPGGPHMGGPPPGAMGGPPGGAMGHFDPSMFGGMAGQNFFPRPF